MFRLEAPDQFPRPLSKIFTWEKRLIHDIVRGFFLKKVIFAEFIFGSAAEYLKNSYGQKQRSHFV